MQKAKDLISVVLTVN